MQEWNNNLEAKAGGKKLWRWLILLAIIVAAIISASITGMRDQLVELRTEFDAYKVETDDYVSQLSKQLQASKEAQDSNSVPETVETYTIEELMNLCESGDYDSMMKVVSYQDTPADVLSLATRSIDSNRYTESYGKMGTVERKNKLNKLEVLILNHPNCTKAVFMHLIALDNPDFMSILSTSTWNDANTLMLLGEKCVGSDRDHYIIALASNEAATEGVLQYLMTLTDIDEINNILKAQLNEMQVK
ncbi:MAG: hypothetical protein HFJ24_01425 [Clostridia bacterium]|nr:hypothetical protein [Clostridia bacterium]MCI9274721.1 hypothetical protein [Clostridia bacterium]